VHHPEKLTKEHLNYNKLRLSVTPNSLLINIINHYRRNYGVQRDRHIIHSRNQPNLGAAIFQAAIAKDDSGKKHGHQNLIKPDLLQQFAIHLCEEEESFRRARSFDDIINNIKKNVDKRPTLKGVGELTIYDTALRIGSFLGLTPDKIYLHRGTRKGARKLIVNLRGKHYINKNELPVPLQDPTLSEAEIEDILCIYKDRFR
jgi:hypothetical protein